MVEYQKTSRAITIGITSWLSPGATARNEEAGEAARQEEEEEEADAHAADAAHCAPWLEIKKHPGRPRWAGRTDSDTSETRTVFAGTRLRVRGRMACVSHFG